MQQFNKNIFTRTPFLFFRKTKRCFHLLGSVYINGSVMLNRPAPAHPSHHHHHGHRLFKTWTLTALDSSNHRWRWRIGRGWCRSKYNQSSDGITRADINQFVT
ncbi:unnamed protein product [Tenebrio molitor]|nr:unnamed protein product [Tenebrio molitor]